VLDVATHAPLATFGGNPFVFSRDGRFLATRTSAQEVSLIQTGTLEVTGRLRTANDIGLWTPLSRDVGHRLAFSPDSRWLAAGCDGNQVQIWDLATRRSLVSLRIGTNSQPPAILFSEGSQLLLTWAAGDNRINFWTTGSWEHAGGLPSGDQRVALSPDGRTLAASANDVVSLWDFASRQKLKDFSSDVGGIWSLAFSPDGRTLAAGSYEGLVKLWNLPTLQEITALPTHRSIVLSLAFSGDGRYLATAGFDDSIKLWQAPDLGKTESVQKKGADK